MDLSTITVADFKARFYRDFQYQQVAAGAENALPDPDYVQDIDITTAFADAQGSLNQALFGTDAQITSAYLLLTAHYMCTNINMSNAGMGTTGAMPVNSRSVGSVSESYTIPEDYIKSPILAGYTTTQYGLKYLQIALPTMTGNMTGLPGRTNP